MPTTMQSALFSDKPETIGERRALLALHAAQLINMKFLSDAMIWDHLIAAEAQAQRVLKVFFNAVEVIPDDSPDDEVPALENAGTRHMFDSNFDYSPDLFRGDAWGYMRLGYKPVHIIHRIVIRFPSPFLANYTVPRDWIKLDHK